MAEGSTPRATPAVPADPTSLVARLHVDNVRRLADVDVDQLTQTYPFLIARLLEDVVTDDDLARAVAATLDPETESLVLIDAARTLPGLVPDTLTDELAAAETEWETTSRLDGPALRGLVGAVSAA